MYKTADQSSLRYTNRLAVLSLLFDRQCSSRSQLARELHISKPAVADNLSLLLSLGIIQDLDSARAASSGCKPRQLAFNNTYCYFIAIDMHYGQPIFALGDIAGNILFEFVHAPDDRDGWLSFFCGGIDRLLDESGTSVDSVPYIAISSPGIFARGIDQPFLNKQFPGWYEGGLLTALGEKYNAKVVVHNDANAAAVGEFSQQDSMRLIDNMLYIKCGVGIGAGLILNRQLFDGAAKAAGELGSTTDIAKAPGNTTLETTVSIPALLARIQRDIQNGASTQLADIPPGQVHFEQVVDAFDRRDPYVLSVVGEIGDELGCAVVNITNLLTVHSVVLGGEYDVFADVLLARIRSLTRQFCHAPPDVSVSSLGRRVGLYGMFTLVRQELFDTIAHLAEENRAL